MSQSLLYCFVVYIRYMFIRSSLGYGTNLGVGFSMFFPHLVGACDICVLNQVQFLCYFLNVCHVLVVLNMLPINWFL